MTLLDLGIVALAALVWALAHPLVFVWYFFWVVIVLIVERALKGERL